MGGALGRQGRRPHAVRGSTVAVTGAVPAATDRNSARALAWWLILAAKVALGLAVVVLPLRLREIVVARPVDFLYLDYTSFVVGPSDVLVIVTLLCWGAALLAGHRRPVVGPVSLVWPLRAWFVVAAVGVVFSVDPGLSIYHLVRLLLLAALAVFVANEVRLGDLVLPIAAQVVTQAAVAIGQAGAQRSIGLDWLGERFLDPTESGTSIVWTEGVRSLRAYGLTDHPNLLGGCLAFALIALVSWYLAGSRWRVPAVGVIAIGAVGLLVSYSRAAWLALAVGLLVVVALLWLRRQHLGDALLLAVAVAIVVAPFAWQRAPLIGVRLNSGDSFAVVRDETRSIEERGTLNSAANALFANSALIGTGLATSPIAMRRAFPDFEYNYQPPHIVLLAAAVETGMFGALAWSLVIAGPFLALLIRRNSLDWTPELIGLTGALAAVTVVGFFDYYTWLWSPGRLWQWILWGLWAGSYLRASGIKIESATRHV